MCVNWGARQVWCNDLSGEVPMGVAVNVFDTEEEKNNNDDE